MRASGTEAAKEIRIEQTVSSRMVAEDSSWTKWSGVIDDLAARRRAIALWVAAGFVLSVALSLFIPKYAAVAQLMPPDSGSTGFASLLPMLSKPELAGFGTMATDLLGGKTSTAIFVKVLKSRSVEDGLVSRFDLRKHYEVGYWEDARQKLERRTTLTEDKKSGVLTIEVRDRNPQFAAALASGYVQELDRVMASVATSAARRERIFIEQRLAEERVALENSQKQFSQFQSSSMALDVPQQTRVMLEAAARLQGELIAQRAQLQGVQEIYTSESPRVQSLHAQIAELERELKKLNVGPLSAVARADGANPYPSVKTLPGLGVQWAELYRDAKTHETIYGLLTQQYEMARIQEAKEIPTVKVLDAAVAPEKKYPRPWVVILVGTLGSFLLACCGAILKVGWESLDEDDPKRLFLARLYRAVMPV